MQSLCWPLGVAVLNVKMRLLTQHQLHSERLDGHRTNVLKKLLKTIGKKKNQTANIKPRSKIDIVCQSLKLKKYIIADIHDDDLQYFYHKFCFAR